MPHTYLSSLPTKGRRKLIASEIQSQLWAFMDGVARNNGFKALVVGGTADHCHVLLSLPATIPLAKAVQLLKSTSPATEVAGYYQRSLRDRRHKGED
jgi:REP-associated tyrosine transposase